MKVDFISVNESEPSSSSDSDFKDVLKSVKSDNKTIKSVKKISSANKYERKKKKPKLLKGFIISPIFDLLFNGDKRTRDDLKINATNKDKTKILPIAELDDELLFNDKLQPVTDSTISTLYFDEKDETRSVSNEKKAINEYGITNFFVQRANQEKLMLHPNYINTKTSRDYQVYFKGRRYYFNINKNGVLSRVEDKNDGS